MAKAIITGGSTGLGFETARGLLALGYEVVITSRNLARAKVATEKLRAQFPSGSISSLALDLSQSASVDSFAQDFAQRYGKWDLLVNNAGAKVLSEFGKTSSGIEYHYGVNAVGHFAITLDLLTHRTQRARVVSVASIVARFAPTKLGPVGTAASYSARASYSASKLANLLFALELQARLGSDNFGSFAAHPGFARAEPYGSISTRFFESFLAQSAIRGALPIIEVATGQEIPGGSYRAPKILELWGAPREAKLPDSCNRKNLFENWHILEELSERKLTL